MSSLKNEREAFVTDGSTERKRSNDGEMPLPAHGLSPLQSYNTTVTRRITTRQLEQICALRNSYFYPQEEGSKLPNIHDSRYRGGGVYTFQTPDELRKAHRKDKSSHFLLLTNQEGTVVGYSRFSSYVPQGDVAFVLTNSLAPSRALGRVLDIKIVMIDRELLKPGQESVVNNTVCRPGNFISDELEKIALKENCHFLKAEVIEKPIPNLMSLLSLRSKGWTRIGNAKSDPYKQLGVEAGVYVKDVRPEIERTPLVTYPVKKI